MNWKFLLITTASCVVVSCVAVFAAYHVFNQQDSADTPAVPDGAAVAYVAQAAQQTSQASPVSTASPPTTPAPVPTLPPRALISADTDLVYEYHYSDGTIQSSTEKPPYFLLGLDLSGLAEKLSGWKITSFTAEKIVLEKDVDADAPHSYIVGVQDGCVAVFYDNSAQGGSPTLKEITSISVNSLPAEDQARLQAGIAADDSSLPKILEAYGS